MEVLLRHILAKKLENKEVEVHLDDIHVHGETKEEHDALLEAVLNIDLRLLFVGTT